MSSIDKYAYLSKLNHVSPALKCFVAVFSMTVCLGFDHWIFSILIWLCMSFMTVYKGGLSARRYGKLLRIPLTFLIIGVLTIIINITSQPSDFVSVPVFSKYLSISRQGLFEGMSIVLKAFASVSCLYFLSLSTPIFEIVGVINRLHCPKIMTELMLLIYRFIFILTDTAHLMMISADSRLGYMTKKNWLHTTGLIAGSLFLKAFKKSSDMYNAMEARCYDGTLDFLSREKKMTKKQYGIIILYAVIVLTTGIILKIKG